MARQSVWDRQKHAIYFEAWGCRDCKRKDVPHGGNGYCRDLSSPPARSIPQTSKQMGARSPVGASGGNRPQDRCGEAAAWEAGIREVRAAIYARVSTTATANRRRYVTWAAEFRLCFKCKRALCGVINALRREHRLQLPTSFGLVRDAVTRPAVGCANFDKDRWNGPNLSPRSTPGAFAAFDTARKSLSISSSPSFSEATCCSRSAAVAAVHSRCPWRRTLGVRFISPFASRRASS